MTSRHPTRLIASAALLLIASAASAQPSLDWFRKLDPAERQKLLAKLPESAYVKAQRGDVLLTLDERGSIDAADKTDVVCRVKTHGKASATTVRWVIDDGTAVKKGDSVLELDTTNLQEAVREQRAAVEKVRAAHRAAEAELKAVRAGGDIDVRLAEVEVKIAEAELRREGGKDREQREILALKVERARLLVERARAVAKGKLAQAEAEAAAKARVVEAEDGRARELADEIKRYSIVAPQDGIAVHLAPEGRFGGKPIVAQGEPVREGQILLRVYGLKKMLLMTHVHEAQIARVRAGQSAAVLVDAFPGKPYGAQVSNVATAASQGEWLAKGVKVYAVQLAIDGDATRLKPSMSAEAQIVLDRRGAALSLPRTAVLGSGKNMYCYVKTAKGIEERTLTLGLVGNREVEVKAGLNEGDEVLRDPTKLAPRLQPKGAGQARPAPVAAGRDGELTGFAPWRGKFDGGL